MMRIEYSPLGELAAGQAVAAEVRDAHGNLLIGAGTVLTEHLLAQLAKRGIQSLPVSIAHEPNAEVCAAIEAELARRFSNVRGQQLMNRLFDTVLHYRLEHS